MITIKNLCKSYTVEKTNYPVLKNLTLDISDGEMVAIKGKSGAGKTTLLNIIGGLDRFDSGNVIIDDYYLEALSDDKLAEYRSEKIGFVLQDFSLINQKSVLFNVMLPMYFDKTPYKEMKSAAAKAIERVGIPEQSKKRAINLSGGQRQRVAIARAIVKGNPILLADEPTGNLDSQTTKEIMNLLTDLNKSGMTVIIVTHDDMVASYCNRIITISDGMII